MEEHAVHQKCVHVLQDGLVTIVSKVRRDVDMSDLYLMIIFQDINECNGNHECDHNCTNNEGSFVCSCDDGYLLQGDGRSCEGTFTTSMHICICMLIID